MNTNLLVLLLYTTFTCLVLGETRHLAGVSSDAVLEVEFYHDIDDTTLTVGTNHACVLSSIEDSDVGGEVVCWGEVFEGQADPPNVRASQFERFVLVSRWQCRRTSSSS